MPFVEGLGRLGEEELEKASSEMETEKKELSKSASELAAEEFLSETLHPRVSKNPLVEEKMNEKNGIVTSADKLASIFKDYKKADFIYEETEKGEIILGYEDVIINGVPTRRPIIQEKVNMSIDDLDMRIEPPLRKPGENNNPYGLTVDELKRYEKLKALSKGFGNKLSEEELIAKAKDVSDLDATIVPDMMLHFVTEKEDEYLDLSSEEKASIKELRKQGIMMEPEMFLGVHKSLELAAQDRTIEALNVMKFLSFKNADISRITTDEAAEMYGEMYRKERRPGLPMVIESEIKNIPKMMYERIRKDSSIPDNAKESKILQFKADPELRRELVEKYEEQTGEKFYQWTDFRKTITYFVRWGTYQEDAEYFNPGKMSAPKDGVPMSEIFTRFKNETNYDFIDVYKYWWDKITELKEKEEEAKSKGLDPNMAHQSVQLETNLKSEEDKFDDIEWE